MDAQAVLDQLGALKDVGTVERVYGQPQTMGERMIIPVAEVRTCMGLGFGSGRKNASEDAPKGEGGGGGGAAKARPVGVVEVTPEGTRFLPIDCSSSSWGLLLLGLGAGMLMAMMSSKCMLAHARRDEE